MQYKIQFCRTTLGKEEIKAIKEVINSGWVVMGAKTKEFEEKFAEYVGAKYAVFVDSGTSALFLALQWEKTKFIAVLPDFYCPSLTFSSTAESIINSGFTIKFVDVNRDDFCMKNHTEVYDDFSIPVHLTGNLADKKAVIYDSAHRIEKNDVKDSSALWCYSFYATKNMTTVQGGMIATNDENAYLWLKKARDHGVTKGTTERYKDGNWRYDIEFVGWREKSDDVHAAIGLEQLKKLPLMTAKRNKAVGIYNRFLKLNRTGNHLYPILVNDRDRFIEYMKENGVQCSVHFLPLHQMTAYKKYYNGEPLLNTEYLGERLVSLPLFPQLKRKEIIYICDLVKKSGLFIHE